MELKQMINKMQHEEIVLDEIELELIKVLNNKYKLLHQFLIEKDLITTNDIKRLNISDYNKLKMQISEIPFVGEEKSELFIKKLDTIRRGNNYKPDVNDIGIAPIVKLVGKFQSSKSVSVEINHLNYNNQNEYIDIRQVKSDGTRGKGISIKKENYSQLLEILNSFTFDRNTESEALQDHHLELTESLEIYNEKKDSLKKAILDNEYKLYEIFKKEYGLSINIFIKKIESLTKDGDIVKFLNSATFNDVKKGQYDLIRQKGFKTAIDIVEEYNLSNPETSSIKDYKIGDLINTMTICSLVNNYNMMLGMYYNKEEDYVILKCQLKDGDYEDGWVEKDKVLSYYLQNEKEKNYETLCFSHLPNQICRDIIQGKNHTTKVYLVYRYHKNDSYTFAGEYAPVSFVNNNKCIMLFNNNEKENTLK